MEEVCKDTLSDPKSECVCVCVFISMIHQEQQNSGLTSRLTARQEDVGKSPARKR